MHIMPMLIHMHKHLPQIYQELEKVYLICGGETVTRYIDGLVQERRNPSALAIESRLSCTNPSIYEDMCRMQTGFWAILAE